MTKNVIKQLKGMIRDYKKESDSLPMASATQCKKEGIAIGLQMAVDLITQIDSKKSIAK